MTNFEQTTAADTWEFLLVKSAFGGAVIVVVWLFVRYGIDLLIAWKSDKLLSAAFAEIALGKIDAAILGIAVLFCGGGVSPAVAQTAEDFDRSGFDLYGADARFSLCRRVVFLVVFHLSRRFERRVQGLCLLDENGKTDHTQNGFWAYVRWE